VASKPATRELGRVFERFLDLTPADQLHAYRAIRNHLADRVRETKRDRIVAEKEEAVAALAAVAAHLSLPAGEAPTPAQFDAAARELDLKCARGVKWDRSRVRRAWGRWRFAKDAFLGREPSRAASPRGRWRRQTHEGRRRAIKLWLATEPEDVSSAAYGAWAREYNDTLPPDELPVPISAATISRGLNKTWPDLIRVGRGEITEAEARPRHKRTVERYCRGPHDLVVFEDLEKILRRSGHGVVALSRRPDFPPPVIILTGIRLWLRDDVKAYKAGRRWTPEENDRQRDSLRHLYLTVDEVKELTGFNRHHLKLGLDGMPHAVVKLGARLLWLRSEVEAWVRKRGQSGR
jgi:predicted DNA-binding transcriptional regulator AlpA